MTGRQETDLYPPIKAYLEEQGYVVKSEIGAADVVAVRGAEPPVVVELKLAFSLTLFHQAIARLAVSDGEEGIAFLPLKDTSARRSVHILSQPHNRLMPAARAFLDFVTQMQRDSRLPFGQLIQKT